MPEFKVYGYLTGEAEQSFASGKQEAPATRFTRQRTQYVIFILQVQVQVQSAK